MKTEKNIKLHLGCGERYLPGYTHVDINKFEHIDIFSPVDKLDMFENNSVEKIYASHILEYFDVVEVYKVLEEWKRILKDKGELKIAVPDFRNLTKIYLETSDINNVIGPIMGRWELSNGEVIYHKQIFDESKLTNILNEVGFKNIERWDWREFILEFPNFDDHSQAYYPHMDKENGIHVSLNLVCYK